MAVSSQTKGTSGTRSHSPRRHFLRRAGGAAHCVELTGPEYVGNRATFFFPTTRSCDHCDPGRRGRHGADATYGNDNAFSFTVLATNENTNGISPDQTANRHVTLSLNPADPAVDDLYLPDATVGATYQEQSPSASSWRGIHRFTAITVVDASTTSLASTGANTTPPVDLAALLLMFGAAALIITRRRATTAPHSTGAGRGESPPGTGLHRLEHADVVGHAHTTHVLHQGTAGAGQLHRPGRSGELHGRDHVLRHARRPYGMSL